GLVRHVSSSWVHMGWEPRTVPSLVLSALIPIALPGASLIPEPVHERKPFRLTVQAPQVPTVVRGPFVLAALGLLSSWTIAALFYSLGPELGAQLFNTDNAIVAGLGVVLLSAAVVASQFLTARTAPWIATSGASI